PQPPYQPGRLPPDAAIQLRRSGAPIHEQDRDLPQTEALLPALERHLDLERVAVRLHAIEPHALECAPAEALETAGGVVDRQPGHQTSVPVREVRQDQAIQGPVDDRDSMQVAGAEHDVDV